MTVTTTPINLNVDNLIHCINRDAHETALLEAYRTQRAVRLARERGRWSECR